MGSRDTSVQTCVEEVTFEAANICQRECLQAGSQGYDGFVLLVGLFLVLLIENLWSFDSTTFSSEASGDAFLALLVAGTAFGLFTIFSVTMVKLKVQRLITRDIYALKFHQTSTPGAPERTKRIHLRRLADRWERSGNRRDEPACISYEWYHGTRYKSLWDPRCPRSLVAYAALSFVSMTTSSVLALAVQLADGKGIWWAVWSCVGIGCAVVLPGVFIRMSVRDPLGIRDDEGNAYHSFA